MFDYRRMSSVFTTEYIPCNQISLKELEEAIMWSFQRAGIPIDTKNDSIKTGMFAKDPCLVIYNPQNLNYHTIVFVIHEINGGRVISMYSAGTADSQHIGGGLLNGEHQANRLKGAFKTNKQKEIEEQTYNSRAFSACYYGLEALGIHPD